MIKQQLREQVLHELTRYSQTPEKYAEECHLGAKLLASPSFKQARSIGIYRSMAHEVDTWPIIQEALETKQVSVPVVKKKRLVFQEIFPDTQYQKSQFGILEPVDAPEIVPETLDLLIVPGVAFTRTGKRLGYGGGYYDRFLAKNVYTTISLAMQLQLVSEEILPIEAHDQRIQQILTV